MLALETLSNNRQEGPVAVAGGGRAPSPQGAMEPVSPVHSASKQRLLSLRGREREPLGRREPRERDCSLPPGSVLQGVSLVTKRCRQASHSQVKWTPGSVLQDGQPIHPNAEDASGLRAASEPPLPQSGRTLPHPREEAGEDRPPLVTLRQVFPSPRSRLALFK